MSTTITAKGVGVTILDAVPATGFAGVPTLSAGEGAPYRLKRVEDMVAWPATNMDAGSYVRLCRFPANAKVKKFELWTDGIIDNNGTAALVLAAGVEWSDSLIDGTPAAVRGLTPTDTGLGTNVATPITTDMNDIFGQSPALGTPYGLAQKGNPRFDWIASLGSAMPYGGASGYAGLDNWGLPSASGAPTQLQFTQTPLLNVLGFQSSTGIGWAAAGFFDVYVRVVTAASTQAGANLFVAVEYAD